MYEINPVMRFVLFYRCHGLSSGLLCCKRLTVDLIFLSRPPGRENKRIKLHMICRLNFRDK